MSIPADELYLHWLIDQVTTPGAVKRYDRILKLLYSQPYIPVHPMDENRAIDGIDLRQEWLSLYDKHAYIYDGWCEEPCSLLEMLIGLAKRAAFTASSMSEPEWFHHILENLNLKIDDLSFDENLTSAYNMIELLESGEVTPFPTEFVNYQNQLWNQMMEYIDVNKLNNYI